MLSMTGLRSKMAKRRTAELLACLRSARPLIRIIGTNMPITANMGAIRPSKLTSPQLASISE